MVVKAIVEDVFAVTDRAQQIVKIEKIIKLRNTMTSEIGRGTTPVELLGFAT